MKKSLKGMTLYEMIIAIAIFAIMTGILVGVGRAIDKTNKSTRNLKSRIVRESPYAANKIKGDASGVSFSTSDMKIVVDFSDDTKSKLGSKLETVIYDPSDPSADSYGKVVKQFDYTSYPGLEMDAKKYETNASFTGEEVNSSTANDIYGGLNLEFVEIEPTT